MQYFDFDARNKDIEGLVPGFEFGNTSCTWGTLARRTLPDPR